MDRLVYSYCRQMLRGRNKIRLYCLPLSQRSLMGNSARELKAGTILATLIVMSHRLG